MFRIRRLRYELSNPNGLGLHAELPTITLRGAFGYALAQVIARQAAVPGLESQVALFRRFFLPVNDGEEASRNRDLAKPFVLRGAYTRPDHGSFILELVTFGLACQYESFFDAVIETVARQGVGVRGEPCRLQKLDAVDVQADNPTADFSADTLLVQFLTPCARLKFQDQIYQDEAPFPALLSRLCDRVLELDALYGDSVLAGRVDVLAVKNAARLVAGTRLEGGVYRVRRTSGRTGQQIALNGFVGTMMYQGDFRPFQDVLPYLPWVHVGRFCVFGCGWCRCEF